MADAPAIPAMSEDDARRITERIRSAFRELEESSWKLDRLRRSLSESGVAANQSLYLMQMGDSGPVKIGVARDVESRRRTIQTGCPYPVHIVYALPGRADMERHLHSRFSCHRLEGEWFDPIPEIFDWFALEAI